jgi:hypothetical protein
MENNKKFKWITLTKEQSLEIASNIRKTIAKLSSLQNNALKLTTESELCIKPTHIINMGPTQHIVHKIAVFADEKIIKNFTIYHKHYSTLLGLLQELKPNIEKRQLLLNLLVELPDKERSFLFTQKDVIIKRLLNEPELLLSTDMQKVDDEELEMHEVIRTFKCWNYHELPELKNEDFDVFFVVLQEEDQLANSSLDEVNVQISSYKEKVIPLL